MGMGARLTMWCTGVYIWVFGFLSLECTDVYMVYGCLITRCTGVYGGTDVTIGDARVYIFFVSTTNPIFFGTKRTCRLQLLVLS